MVKTVDIIAALEEFAPLSTAQPWDNVGWQVNFANPDVKKIMLCLTVTESVISQAIDQNCDFILSHHPVFFDPIKKIADKSILEAIKNGIQMYSVHTNFDSVIGGTSDMLGWKMGFDQLEVLNEFVRVKRLDNEISVEELTQRLKHNLNVNHFKMVNLRNLHSVKSIAFCAGSGGSFIQDINIANIDLFVTGDVKYHDALDSDGLVIFDIGHYDSEKFVTDIFKNILQKLEVELIVAHEEDIWKIV